jgi:Family of unknown function (DUF5678)
MNQDQFERELAVNRQAYERLRDQIRRQYGHKYVALAFGRVVAATPTFDEASAAVDNLQPRPQHFVVFEADGDPMFEVIDDPRTEILDQDSNVEH